MKYLSKIRKNQKGFTLLEVLLVVAIIAILAAIVIIAINPGQNLQDTRNAQRRADINTIMNAVYQWAVDGNDLSSLSLPATATEICASDTADCATPGLIDLSTIVSSGDYIPSLPEDPTCAQGGTECASGDGIGYTILEAANGRLTIAAPDAEDGETIEVTR